MVKERDTGIDFVKFVALFLVLNSHMGMSYVDEFKSLATGGAIGDALFFFASGFTLFLGRDLDFVNWYKRRINRIYPSLMAVAIIGAAVFSANESFVEVFLAKKYWFIQCIFILYPLLYLVKRYVKKREILLIVLTIIVMGIYSIIHKGELFYAGGYYRWAVYLLFMLLGAIMGKEREKIRQINVWLALLLTAICIIAWYGLLYFLSDSWLQVITIIPLMAIAVFMYSLGKSKPLMVLFNSKIFGPVLISIGALCLESYLIQKYIITDSWNGFFPFNIPLIMICVLVASYCSKILANFINQIFDSEPIDWKKLLVLY